MILTIDPDSCTGCRSCELACSFNSEEVCNPSKSSIRVSKLEPQLLFFPTVCRHCTDAPCMRTCPTNAIRRDTDSGGVKINEDSCIECYTCFSVCPFGAISWDKGGDLIKCDLCDGDPECVKYCESEALKFERPELSSQSRRFRIASSIASSSKKGMEYEGMDGKNTEN